MFKTLLSLSLFLRPLALYDLISRVILPGPGLGSMSPDCNNLENLNLEMLELIIRAKKFRQMMGSGSMNCKISLLSVKTSFFELKYLRMFNCISNAVVGMSLLIWEEI